MICRLGGLLSRREALRLMGALSAAALAACSPAQTVTQTAASAATATSAPNTGAATAAATTAPARHAGSQRLLRCRR